MVNLIIIGPAGSGKSTLTKSFGKWLENEGIMVDYVNLDPGAEKLPFTPSFDVRNIVKVEELMRKEDLGPNGALIRAAEIMEERFAEVLEAVSALAPDFLLVDTPGQMEIFLFRTLGPKLASSLRGRTVSAFLIDPVLMKKPNDFMVLKMLGLVVELRLGIPSIEIVNKCDLLSLESLRVMEDSTKREIEGLVGSLAEELRGIIEKLEKKKRTLMVSATEGTGFLELYKAIGEAFCACGDLT
ncbi:MAG: ATP/GTP-binding protein [Candidatus Methanomethyliaceae archaeon]|nr:ATP/GTP-binding protein [Candidatus Methanomethyliaceae archaeon]